MNLKLSSAHKTKVGTCPHGLPQGACPICSGMGGGGGSASTRKARPAGEMTWDQCYSVWQQMLRAKEQAQLKRQEALQAQMQPQITFSAKLANLAQKIAATVDNLSNFVQKAQAKPSLINNALAFAAKLAIPVLNVLNNVSVMAQKAASFVTEKIADISDKLNAIFGEIKNFTEKKISDKLKNFKKKFKSLFGIFESEEIAEEVDCEEKRLEENKRIFEMKETFHQIQENTFTQKKELEYGGS